MNGDSTNKVHWSFWVIIIFMLIWNLMGSINFVVQLDQEMVSSYPESEQVIIQGRPFWATIGFAASVFGGAVGCILLLLKRSSAIYLFIASLIGTITAIAHSLTLNITFGIGEVIGIVLMPVIISLFLIWYSKHVQNKGWLQAHNNLSKRDAEKLGAPS
jgi:hypothetical protein